MPEVRIIVTVDGDGLVSGVAFAQDNCPGADFCLPGHEVVVDKRTFLDGEVAMVVEGLNFSRKE